MSEVIKENMALTCAIETLAEYGIPPDIQELLIYGNTKTGIRIDALESAIKSYNEYMESSND